VPNALDLGFAKSNIKVNNLEQSDFDNAQEIRFSGVGTYNQETSIDPSIGRSLDLVVRVRVGRYVKNDDGEGNGLVCGYRDNEENDGTGDKNFTMCSTGGHFAKINVASGVHSSGGQKRGEWAKLTFTVEWTDSQEAVILPGFLMTFADIDQEEKIQEVLAVSGYHKAIYDKTSEDVEFSESSNQFTATSKMFGSGCDNPDDPMNLQIVTCDGREVDQAKRAVMFAFKDTSSFDVTFQTTCANCQPGGRNFLFSFKSLLVAMC
jgi:hypothetical protein